MSTRDRFLSSLSSAHDQVRSAVDQHLSQLQQQYDHHTNQQQGAAAGPSQRPSQADLHRQGTLPTYAARPNPRAPSVPDSVLEAPPGRAQETYDSMPRSRLENLNAAPHDRRKAAEEMRREQEMLHRSAPPTPFDQGQHIHRQAVAMQPAPLSPQEQRERAAGLKRTHTYASGNGKVLVDLFTLPQRSPTFMGGSAERGRGAMTGQVIVFANDADKVGAVRLKVKAVARVALPRSHYPPGVDPNARSAGPPPTNQPLNLVGRSPKVEPTQAKEHLLLQLEKTLWSPDSRRDDVNLRSPDGRVHDPTVWRAGRHAFDFKVDLPAKGKDGTELPPSFVFLSDSQASSSTVKQAQISGAVVNAKKWITEASQGGLGGNTGEWASVKWYAKVTVEKPGIFKANERVFAPFVYLPPPPAKVNDRVIPRRLRLSQELRENPQAPAQALAEPASEWGEAELDLTGQTHYAQTAKGRKNSKRMSSANNGSGGGGGGIWSKLFKGPLVSSGQDATGRTRWSIALPNRPAIWPLRSTMPFDLKVQGPLVGQPGARPSPPSVGLFLRVTLFNASRSFTTGKNAPTSATETRLISVAQLFSHSTHNAPSMGGPSHTWRGLLEFPPQATPCFDSNLIQAEYFVAVQTMPQQPASSGPGAESIRPVGRIAWAEKVVLVCPLPTIVRPPPSQQQRQQTHARNTPRTRGGVRRVPSASRRRMGASPSPPVTVSSNTGTIKATAPPTVQTQLQPQRRQDAGPSMPPRPSSNRPALAEASPSGTRTPTRRPSPGDAPSGAAMMIPVGSASTRPANSRRGSAASHANAPAAAAAAAPSPRVRSRRGSPPSVAGGSDVSAAASLSSSSHHGHRRGSGTSSSAAAGGPAPARVAGGSSSTAYPPEKVPLATIPSSSAPDSASTSGSHPPAARPLPPPQATRPRTSRVPSEGAASRPTPSSSRRSSIAPSTNGSEWSYEDDSQDRHDTHNGGDDGDALMEDFDADMQGMGMDLPPSYFEATGLRERDED